MGDTTFTGNLRLVKILKTVDSLVQTKVHIALCNDGFARLAWPVPSVLTQAKLGSAHQAAATRWHVTCQSRMSELLHECVTTGT